MLLQNSCYLHFSLYAFLLNALNCQQYDNDHHQDDHDHLTYSDDHYESPDYSKYYSIDSSSPIIQSTTNNRDGGFIPSEFRSFFGHSHFDFGGSASNQKETSNKPTNFLTNSGPIPHRDYFEESQQKDKEDIKNVDSYESRPGPNYISHKLPAKQNVDEVDGSSGNAEEFNFDGEEEDVKDLYKKNDDVEVITDGYIDGESSYKSAGTKKYSPDYYTRLTSTPTLTPYQKFSFQPVDDYNFTPATSKSKVVPFNPNYNQYLPLPSIKTDYTHQETTSNCKKINKLGTTAATKDQIMDCYSCEDPKTGHNYEQCSYSSEPTPKSYYFTNSKKYKPTEHSQSYRYKRFTATDPYEYVKAKSQYNPEKEYNKEEDEYRFGPEYFEEDGEKSYSEKESEKLISDGEHCVRQKKQGMTCMVCKNERTGGKYEQCAYATEPREQKYAYVKEKKYNSKEIPEETEQKSVKKPKYQKKYSAKVKGEKRQKPVQIDYIKPIDTRRQTLDKLIKPKRKNTDDEYSEDDTRDKSVDYAEVDEQEDEDVEEAPMKKKKSYTLREYHFKIFPEFTNEESKKAEINIKPADQIKTDFDADQTKDVEEVLAEFAKKDRSKCQKSTKQGMTCYLCIDDSGLQNEECMYISESKPKATFTAYHEAKELVDRKNRRKLQPQESQKIARQTKTTPVTFDIEATDSKQVNTTAIPVRSRKYGRDKNISKPRSGAEDQLIDLRIKRNTKKTRKHSKKSKPTNGDDDLLNADDDIEPPIYEHEKLEGADGAFSAETRPAYSKVYDATIPKYMLEKSISEQEFDDFVANN